MVTMPGGLRDKAVTQMIRLKFKGILCQVLIRSSITYKRISMHLSEESWVIRENRTSGSARCLVDTLL